MERECNAERGETPNDAFFTEQRDAFESGRSSFLEGGKTATPFGIVCRAFVNHAREYVRGAVGEEAAPFPCAVGRTWQISLYAFCPLVFAVPPAVGRGERLAPIANRR